MISTTAALVLGGLTAGSQIAGSVIQGKSAKKASEQQIAAAERAKVEQAPLYQEARRIAQEQAALGQAQFAPYTAAGSQGLTSLTALLGLSGIPSGAPAPMAVAPPQPIAQTPPNPAGTTRTRPPGTPAIDVAVPRGTAGVGVVGTPGGPVLLRAPNGQVQAVRPQDVDFFVARGAVPVTQTAGAVARRG